MKARILGIIIGALLGVVLGGGTGIFGGGWGMSGVKVFTIIGGFLCFFCDI